MRCVIFSGHRAAPCDAIGSSFHFVKQVMGRSSSTNATKSSKAMNWQKLFPLLVLRQVATPDDG